jgi:alcohol dehydrogenase
MKALLLEQPRHFRQIEIDEPPPPGPGDVVVQVHRVGICGSDISGYLGKMPFYSYPRIPGHELGVEVVSCGSGVTHVKPGDRCSVEPYMNCQTCFACKRGGFNCCENLKVLGVHTDGGLRPLFTVPARKLHPSSKLTLEQLALVETLAIGCHCVDRSRITPGDHALVIGAGPIGLSVIEFLKLAGAEITVLDLNEQRLEFCRRQMGVAHTVLSSRSGQHEQQLLDITSGARHPVVIDATGSAASMTTAFNYVAHTGRLLFVGITQDTVSFGHPLVHRREMTICGSRNALPGDFTRIIGLIEAGNIDTRPWITHHTPFSGLIDAFPTIIQPETGVIKAIVHVEE